MGLRHCSFRLCEQDGSVMMSANSIGEDGGFMRPASFLASGLLLLGVLACPLHASAQSIPPIKTGLWEARLERSFDGKREATQLERMQVLPNDIQARIRDQLKYRGVTPEQDSGSSIEVCINQEVLRSGSWLGIDQQCSVAFSLQTERLWKWQKICPYAKTDGSVTFKSPEQYLFQTETTYASGSNTQHVQTIALMRWIGNDCNKAH